MPKHYTTTAGRPTRSFPLPIKPCCLSTIHLIQTGPLWVWMASMALRHLTTSKSPAKQSKGRHQQHCHHRPRREKRSRNSHRAQSHPFVVAQPLLWLASCTSIHLPRTCHQPAQAYHLESRSSPLRTQTKSPPHHHYLNVHLPNSSRRLPHSTLLLESQTLQALQRRRPLIEL